MTITKELQKKGAILVERLITKAHNDDAFKAEFISFPEKKVKELAGDDFTLPVGKKIHVEDQSSQNTIFINITPKINYDEITLSDEQLEVVSGGEVAMSLAGGMLLAATIFGAGYAAGYYNK